MFDLLERDNHFSPFLFGAGYLFRRPFFAPEQIAGEARWALPRAADMLTG